MAAKRRRFGKVRKLPSGQYQASFIGPSGIRQTAPRTFRTKTDADRWLTAVETDLSRGTWLDDTLGRQPFATYARTWLRDHPKMGPRYRETCERNLRLHLTALHEVPLRAITSAVVREWYAAAMRGKGGRASLAQSYRFLRAVLSTAVRDGAITKNPCQIPGAGSDRAKERPVATPAQVAALIEAITPRYRAAVLLAAWCGLRRGEVLGLRPADVDLTAATVTVRRNRVELLEKPQAYDAEPKTDAGKRTVTVPPHVLPILAVHMETWAGTDRVFIGRDGRPMRGDAVRQAFDRARLKADMRGFRFHDLRHTGQTLAAATGATTKDLMRRLGHASPVASNRYLHAVDGRDAEIAAALSDLAAHGDASRLPRSIVIKH
jgi:integrase